MEQLHLLGTEAGGVIVLLVNMACTNSFERERDIVAVRMGGHVHEELNQLAIQAIAFRCSQPLFAKFPWRSIPLIPLVHQRQALGNEDARAHVMLGLAIQETPCMLFLEVELVHNMLCDGALSRVHEELVGTGLHGEKVSVQVLLLDDVFNGYVFFCLCFLYFVQLHM